MILKTLKDIAGILKKSNIPYMVVGGQAIVVYGKPRFTQDVDIIVALIPEEAEPLLNAVSAIFRILPEDVKRFIRETWVLPLEHKETKVRVDVVFSIIPFEKEAIEKTREIRVDNVSVKYIAPEYLVVQKIIAGRARDLEDAAWVLEVQGNKIDIAEIERIIKTVAKGKEGTEWLKRWRRLKKRT